MKPDAAIQQQSLQKEFNDLVLKLSQQVSDKHLSDTNKNIAKVNSDIAHRLDNHVSLLNELSENHRVAVNTSITKLNEHIPSQLDRQSLALQSIEKNLSQYQNETYNAIKNHSDQLATIYEQQLKTEISKVMQKMETSFAIHYSEINELKNHHRKGANELQRDLDTKIESIKRAILYAVIALIICVGSPLAFLIYAIVIR